MKLLINKSFVTALIMIAAVAMIIGMVTGPLGYEDISVGFSAAACIFAVVIVGFGLKNWKNKR